MRQKQGLWDRGCFEMGERTPPAANARPELRLQLGLPGLGWEALPWTWAQAMCRRPLHAEPGRAAGCLSSAPAVSSQPGAAAAAGLQRQQPGTV